MSWEQWLNILDEARERARQERTTPPSACPEDGTPLQAAPDGSLKCRFCGWKT